MKQFISFLLLIVTLISCNQKENNKTIMKEGARKSIESSDTVPKVTGIGGIFFKSNIPQKTKEWYRDNLGLSVDDYGSPFEFRNANNPKEINYLNWDVFQDSTDFFAPSKKEFMINYRVQNIEGLVRKLKSNGVTIIDEIATYDYGKFVHVLDSDGNKIELGEPVDSVLTNMGRQTTK